ncbi:hypothetical protein WJX73_009255 [Symbiochloris irregularis]|uniref:Fungal lipase-type domain-containing protein n=1 Tax=Symbiochloris irregularis TaxID=706552 RepID=A0AAW1P0Q3_9CHLO
MPPSGDGRPPAAGEQNADKPGVDGGAYPPIHTAEAEAAIESIIASSEGLMSVGQDRMPVRTAFDWDAFLAAAPEYEYELQSPQLERLRSAQSKGGSSLYSSLNRSSLTGRSSLTPSRGLHSSSSNSRSVSHSGDSSSTHNPALQQRPSLPNSSPQLSSRGSHLERWDRSQDVDKDEYEQMWRTSLSSSAGSHSGHYNPQNDVIMRIEFLGEKSMKTLVTVINLAELLALAILLLVVLCRALNGPNAFLRHKYLWILNVLFGGVCLVALGTFVTAYYMRVLQAVREGKHWSYRRKKGAKILAVELAAQMLNLLMFVAANAYVLGTSCRWFTAPVFWLDFVSWLCWNTVFCTSVVKAHSFNLWVDKKGRSKGDRPDAMVHDAPFLKTHWWLGLLWLFGLGIKIAVVQEYQKGSKYPPPSQEAEPGKACGELAWNCQARTRQIAVLVLATALFLVYVCLFLYYVWRSFRQLSTRPYRDYRMANMAVRFSMRTRSVALTFFILCLIVYDMVQFNNCSSWAADSLGYLPMHIVFTCLFCVEAFCGMPREPNDEKHLLQAWLQEFAWTEAEKLSKYKARGSSLPENHNINREPMFCFETAIKMYYYAHLVYDYEQIIDETFEAKRKVAETAGEEERPRMYCDHMDMCPVASTAKLKHKCREAKDGQLGYRPCRSDQGFWASAKKAFGLQPCPEEFRKRQDPLQHLTSTDHSPQPHPSTASPPTALQQPAAWAHKAFRNFSGLGRGSDRGGEQLQVAGLRAPQQEKPWRRKKSKGKRSRRKKGAVDVVQKSADEADLSAAEEGVHFPTGPQNAHIAADNIPNGKPNAHHASEKEDPVYTPPTSEGTGFASSSSKSLPANVAEAAEKANAEEVEFASGPSFTLGLRRVLGSWLSCNACGQSDSDSSSESGLHKPTLADTHAKPKDKEGRQQERRHPEFMLDIALGMYDLTHVEVFWERQHDTHALLAWGPSRLVVVFRGTASFANVLADLQAWQMVHPPRRGTWWNGTRPCVHRGFLQSWTANDLNKRLIARIKDVISEAALNPKLPKFLALVTGHSLGGALAQLAAYDIAMITQDLPLKVHICCYTFGAPRVGNHAFADDFNAKVPDSWSIINDQDLVARQGKFLAWYKRPGQRVLINPQGDLLVRPTFVELSIHNRPLSSSVSQHMLISYRTSLAAVVKAQADRRKRMHGGLQGMLRVLQGQFMRDILAPAGVVYDDVVKKSRWAFLEGRSFRHRKLQNPNSFRLRAPELPRARRLDEEAAAAAVAAADGYASGWDGIDFSSAWGNRPCHQRQPSSGNDSDAQGPASVAVTVEPEQNGHLDLEEGAAEDDQDAR